jgi:hypothetical protein
MDTPAAVSSRPGAKLKYPTGWFAAGREVARATTLLSDGAFKLYIYLCLNADRSTGRLRIDHSHLAKALQKSRRSIVTYIEELVRQQVCRSVAAVNQHLGGSIEIADSFWPYERGLRANSLPCLAAYTERIRVLMQTHRCIVGTFGPADEKLAAELFRRQIPPEQVEHAFLLGCARKYVAMLNGQASGPVASLKYFCTVIDEVGELQTSADYWKYLRNRAHRLEHQWLQKTALPNTSCPSQT